jgi:hypothetical protein
MQATALSGDLKRWFGALLFWVVLLYVVWSALGGSDVAIAMIFQISRWLIPLVMDESARSVAATDTGVWQVMTTFKLKSVSDGFAVVPISAHIQFRAVMPIPLTLALVLSSDFRRLDRLVVAAAAAMSVSTFTVMASLAGTLVALSSESSSMGLIAPEYSAIRQGFSSLLTYLMVVVSPIVSPLLIWAITCRRSILTLFFPQS